jgi:hypothetical protein
LGALLWRYTSLSEEAIRLVLYILAIILGVLFVKGCQRLIFDKKVRDGARWLDDIARPVAIGGITIAYKLAMEAADHLRLYMAGTERKRIADLSYNVLPSSVRERVSRETYSKYVQAVFDEFVEQYETVAGHFEEAFQEWIQKQKEEPPE